MILFIDASPWMAVCRQRARGRTGPHHTANGISLVPALPAAWSAPPRPSEQLPDVRSDSITSVPLSLTSLLRHATGARGAGATMVEHASERAHRSATASQSTVAGSTACTGM